MGDEDLPVARGGPTPATDLAPARVAAAAGVLSRALAADPGWIHVFPDASTRVARLARLLALIVQRHYVRLGGSDVIDGAAAAIWSPPGTHAVPAWTALAMAPRLGWLIGRRVPAALRLYREMARRAPRTPHHYLAVLGVDPAHQGRGLGAAIIQPGLERCDRSGTIAWLESTNPANHSFYHRLGFAPVDALTIAGGPTLTWFRRAPQAPRSR